ncbi:MAG: GAF domain-containing protein [Verrucomicrobiota bacterium]
MKKLLDECLPGCAGMDAHKNSLPTLGAGCRVVDELSLLFDISYTLESSLELREVIRPVLLKMADGLGMKRGTITILNREDGTPSISEAVGLPSGQSQQDYLVACRDLVRQVIESGQAIVVPDISKETALKTRWQQEQQLDPKSPRPPTFACPSSSVRKSSAR